ncbi:hypothetical protein COBT_002194 [Conglomerata obtusa]
MPSTHEIRTTLSSAIKKNASEYKNSERIKEAIEKMMFLAEPQFSDLLNDIQDEIERRKHGSTYAPTINESHSPRRTRSRHKLSRLSPEKFENLVIDILLVFNHRNKDDFSLEHKNVDEIESLIIDLEVLIKEMKSKNVYEESILTKVEKESTFDKKFCLYNNFVRSIFLKHKIDTRVVDYVNKMFEMTYREKNVDISYLFIPENLFNEVDQYLHDNLEYQYHKKNIQIVKDNNEIDDIGKENIVRKEILNICDLFIRQKSMQEIKNPVETIDEEVTSIIQNLESIKIVMKSNNKEEYADIASSVINASSELSKKLNTIKGVDKQLIDKIFLEKKNLENCIELQNFDYVPNGVFNMANLVKIILFHIPTLENSK